jgi:putative phosphoesterase
LRLGLISDTHGLFRPEVSEVLAGSELILHMGDIGKSAVLEHLAEIAPVMSIRGNIDTDKWALKLPSTLVYEVNGWRILMCHEINKIKKINGIPEKGYHIVVYGHSHQPEIKRQDGVLYINPGSAGPRRFSLPVTVARMNLPERHEKHSRRQLAGLRPKILGLI